MIFVYNIKESSDQQRQSFSIMHFTSVYTDTVYQSGDVK